MQSADLTRASNIIIWNKWIMGFLGLWPGKVNQFLFLFFTAYMIIYCSMAVSDLIKNSGQLEFIVTNLTDNVLFVMILGKMLICRRSCKIMAKFLKNIENDFSTGMYDNVQEKMAYLHYNEIALMFLIVFTGVTVLSTTMYYFKTFLENWDAKKESLILTKANEIVCFRLELIQRPFLGLVYAIKIKDMSTYIYVCVYLSIAIPIIISGFAGVDAFVLGMVLHVCGQFAALSCKVNNLLKDHENYHRHINNIILRHRHLITLAEILENNFNLIYLQQTLTAVLLLCFTTYNVIKNSEDTNVIFFALYATLVIGMIFAYCYAGECLIIESTGLREAFYNSDWYNNSPSRTKLIIICMTRAEKPSILTAGKFIHLSLNTFTSIIKTSMAYLSMLRHFI